MIVSVEHHTSTFELLLAVFYKLPHYKLVKLQLIKHEKQVESMLEWFYTNWFFIFIYFFLKDEHKVEHRTISNTGIYMHLRN